MPAGSLDGKPLVEGPSFIGGSALLADELFVSVVPEFPSAPARFAKPKSPLWLGLPAAAVVAISSHKPSVSVSIKVLQNLAFCGQLAALLVIRTFPPF